MSNYLPTHCYQQILTRLYNWFYFTVIFQMTMEQQRKKARSFTRMIGGDVFIQVEQLFKAFCYRFSADDFDEEDDPDNDLIF